MVKDLISVLMPVYNTKGEYLKEAIESILNQTYQDFEFLILDDGSTNEDTLSILASFLQKDARIKVIKGEHKGIGVALNKLIEISKGEYLARMDSDDISLPDRFEKQIKFLNENPNVGILSSSYWEFPSGKIINRPEYIQYITIIKDCSITHPAVMMRKSVLDKYNLRYNENLTISEDYELWSRAVRYTQLANIREPLLKYRVLENSNYHKNIDAVVDADNKIRQNMLDFLTDDKELQQNIWNLIFPPQKPSYTFWEKIFSVKNWTANGKKQKILTILGIKLKFRKYENVRIVKLMGGLGNQMFQYAFGKALEAKTGQTVLFDKSWFEDAKKLIINDKNEDSNGVVIRKYDLDIFNPKIEFSTGMQLLNCKKKIVEKHEFIFDEKLLKKRKSAIYEGYFQNEKYFKDIKEIIKKEFKFPQIPQEDEFNQNWLRRINECENPVFIHLRRGDYLNLDGWTLSIDYYKKAIEYVQNNVKNPTFFVFGQNCQDYIEKEFSNLNAKFEIIGEENSNNKEDWKDIALMLECKHAIIANSTFSWWAAWLGNANDGIVVAPTPFVNGQDKIICDNWVKIER